MTGSPGPYEFWSLREDVHVETDPDTGIVTLHSRWDDVILPPPEPAMREALRRMCYGPIRLEHVCADLGEQEGIERKLSRFEHLVVRSLGIEEDQPILSVVPLAPAARFLPVESEPDRMIRLSTFAMLRTDGDGYYLESPLSLHRVVLHGQEAGRLIAALGRPVRSAALEDSIPYAHAPLAYLSAAGMVVFSERDSRGHAPVFLEDEDPVLAPWSPLDLMFHTRTTLGRHDQDFGATGPMEQLADVEPVVKPAMGRSVIDLYRPRWEEIRATDPPLTAAIEASRPARRFGETPPNARDLGELLYRTARVRSLIEEEHLRPPVALSDRPYPNSGHCYPFEIYVGVNNCVDLPRGVYHYDPVGHRLELVDATIAGVEQLLEDSRVSGNLVAAPPLLIAITARFSRVSWQYNGLSYALVLKDLGLLMQTLLLISTAIGLAACPVDGGDIERSAQLLGTDWRIESSIAGLAIGRHGEPPDTSGDHTSVNDADWPSHSVAELVEIWRARCPQDRITESRRHG